MRGERLEPQCLKGRVVDSSVFNHGKSPMVGHGRFFLQVERWRIANAVRVDLFRCLSHSWVEGGEVMVYVMY